MSTGVITGTARSGVRVGSNASIDNEGTITGLTGIVFRDAGAGFGAPTNGSVFNAGTITGTGGTAINFAFTAGAGPFTLTIAPTSVINGNVLGTGADTFQLGGTGTGSFNVNNFGAAQQYRGFATFNKVGTSTWTLSGSGAQNWTISQGTLIGDTNSLAGASITDNAALVYSQNFNGTHAGAISGSGTLAKTGSGTLVLTGMNTYTGATTVSGGTLEVDGSIAASQLTTVNSGTALTGTGTVGNALIANGAMFAPGNGMPGTSMTIAGNLAFQSGAMYLVQLNPTTASSTNVTGTATLNGATVDAMFANGTYVAKQYTILTANGGVSGAFGSVVNTNLPAGFHTTLSSDANDVFLNLVLNFVGPPGVGLNVNQQNVANAITGFFNTNGTIPLVFGGLTAAGLTQLSGEIATTSQQTTFDAMSLFMGLLTDPFMDRGGVPGAGGVAHGLYTKAPPVAYFNPRWSVWAAGYGGSQTTSGNAVIGSNDTTSRIFGTAVGADYLFAPHTIAGVALAGGGTNFSVNNLGSGRSDLFQAGAYLRHSNGAAYLSAAAAYGWQDITTDRTVTVAGIDRLHAEFNANAWSGRLEGGYRFVAPWVGVGITPYAAGQFTSFDLPRNMERAIVGANTFALGFGAKSVTDTRSELGIRTDRSFAMQNGILTLRGRFAWAHDFDPDRAISATFLTLPGASFVVNGAAQARDSALTTASVEWKWVNGWSAAATFEGQFSKVTESYAGKGVVRYQW
jgi:autotransporter-associated beta strand protein